MNSDETIGPDGTKDSASRRWAVDAAGRPTYYPRGKGFSGYLVTDRGRERAIRDADRRFDEVSKQVAPFTLLLLLPVIELYYYFSSSHPMLACVVFPAAIALLGFFIWLIRRPTVAPLLGGLTCVPPVDLAGQKRLY